MAYVVLALLVLVVLTLSFASRKRRMSCCAPTDPADDLRMRALLDDDRTSNS